MINFSLAREIYGLTPWFMDVHSIPVMSSLLGNFKNGVSLEIPKVKYNTPHVYIPKSETKIVVDSFDLRNNDDFEGVAVIFLNGPITKYGGLSSVGMLQLSALMYQLNQDNRIKSFIILADSGGGSSSAVQIMIDTINEIKQEKPVIGLVDKGGMSASACYGILSACDEIYAEDKMSIVGSVGTMIQFEGFEANTKDMIGRKHIRLYASKSIRKNEEFEEALNKDNFKLLINDLLDPINENFISEVLKNRPSLKSTGFDDGRTQFAGEAIGTFIDDLKSFDQVVEISLSKSGKKITKNRPPDQKSTDSEESPNNSKNKSNLKNKKMTKAEFQAANPDAYAEIVAEGVASEKDRAGAWLAHVDTDAEAVVQGINSGKAISQTEREAFFVKQNALKQSKTIEDESEDDIITPESKGGKEKVKSQMEKEIKEAFDFELN